MKCRNDRMLATAFSNNEDFHKQGINRNLMAGPLREHSDRDDHRKHV